MHGTSLYHDQHLIYRCRLVEDDKGREEDREKNRPI